MVRVERFVVLGRVVSPASVYVRRGRHYVAESVFLCSLTRHIVVRVDWSVLVHVNLESAARWCTRLQQVMNMFALSSDKISSVGDTI